MAHAKANALKKKLHVKHEPSMKFSPSTSYDSKGANKKTFKTSEGRHKEFVKGFTSAGYQAHRTAKDKQRGIN